MLNEISTAGLAVALAGACWVIVWQWQRLRRSVPLRNGSRLQLEITDPVRSLHTPLLDGPDYTFGGPTHQCLCGNNLFHLLAAFEDRQVSYYVLDGICHRCGAKVTVPYETQEV